VTSGLSGRVIVVTGCAQGIGRAACLAAASAGMKVVGLDVNIAGGEETARLCVDAGAEAWFFACDISDPEELEAVFGQIERTAGPTEGSAITETSASAHTGSHDTAAARPAHISSLDPSGETGAPTSHTCMSTFAASVPSSDDKTNDEQKNPPLS